MMKTERTGLDGLWKALGADHSHVEGLLVLPLMLMLV